MARFFLTALALLSAAARLGNADPTDTLTWGGDNSRSSYRTGHNMDPTIVGSDEFAQIFKTPLPGTYNGAAEQIFSQPLVYTTPADGVQYVYWATTQNNVYKMNAKTGVIVTSTNLGIPFLTADLDGCVDINPTVGITSTGVIDPSSGTLYLTVKTYANQNGGTGPQGKPAGRYFVHALSVDDLSKKPNFPVALEGYAARNNPSRTFNGGIHLQRPGLLLHGQYLYAGFGSHCVQYNFTGWIMGWDKTTGANVEKYALQGKGVPNTTPGASIWMSGGGLASDDAGSIFFSTGNGYASQLATVPVNGRNPPTALEQAVVHMTIAGDGSLTPVDFFMPFEKTDLDGADKDLGTSPLNILPSEFSCGEARRIGVVTGKSGKTYFLNLDDLGGYKNGPGALDKVLGTYLNENSVYAGAGVYPGEGGYIYINPIGFPTRAFKFTCSNGAPTFARVAQASMNNAGVVGVSHGVTTSLNGQPGTGLVWVTDVQGSTHLRVFRAVPDGGDLTLIKSFPISGVTKFTRPVFGNGIVYIGTTVGFVYGFGAPVNQPLNCSSPYQFGSSQIGVASAPRTITCKAKIAMTVSSIALNRTTDFSIAGLPTLPLNLAAGASFAFSATFAPSDVGLLTQDVVIKSTNNVAGYSKSTQVSLSGTGTSSGALFRINPKAVTFNNVITGQDAAGVTDTFIFENLGNSSLTISGLQYSTSASDPWSATPPAGTPFTFINVPTTIPALSNVAVTVQYKPTQSGSHTLFLMATSNGGNQTVSASGKAGPAPVTLVEFQTTDGLGWVTFDPAKNFTFGNVTENTTRRLKMRVTNNGGPGAVPLSITVSKPPFAMAGSIIGSDNNVDLGEGVSIAAGESATANLYCNVPKRQWNTDSFMGYAVWTMNTNGGTDKMFFRFDCNAVAEQAPPLKANGDGRYRYVGCFKENNPGRQLSNQLYGNDANTNAMCIQACNERGFTFCGTQYHRECWGGDAIPNLKVDDANCNFYCSGALQQNCGGNGVQENGAFISLFADGNKFDGNTTTPPPTPGGPYVNPGVNGYTSLGCYTEGSGGRALPQQLDVTRTVAECVNGCSARNFQYAGVEYGGECFCGNTLGAGSVPAPAAQCNMVCNANQTEYCGGPSRLNLYQKGPISSSSTSTSSVSSTSTSTGTTSGGAASTTPTNSPSRTPTAPAIRQNVAPNWAFDGCYTEATGMRALTGKTYADDAMTLESCAAYCSGFSIFGVEYGRECYCGNSLNPGSVRAANQNDCSFLCPGDRSTFCGAGNRLQLYRVQSVSSSETSRTSSSTVSSSTSTSTSNSVTTSSVSSSTQTTSSTSSSTTTTTSASSTPTTPFQPETVGTWTWAGCRSEATGIRALDAKTFADDTMTLEACADFCAGYNYFGVEYGRECYCGNSFNSGSTTRPSSECSFLCPGEEMNLCGAGDRLSAYTSVAPSQQAISSSSSASSSSSVTSSSVSSSMSISTTTTTTTTTTVASSVTSSSAVPSSSSSSASSSSSTVSSSISSSISSSLSTSTTSTTTTTTRAASSVTSSSVIPSSSSSSASSSSSTASSSISSSISSSVRTSTTTTTSATTRAAPSVTSSSAVPSSSSSSSSSTRSPTPSPTSPSIVPGNANFTYYSCMLEPTKGKLLNKRIESSQQMTVERCFEHCKTYAWAGLEYGSECWCGNALTPQGNAGAVPGRNLTDSECSFTCPGNRMQYCGARSRMTVYKFDPVAAAQRDAAMNERRTAANEVGERRGRFWRR